MPQQDGAHLVAEVVAAVDEVGPQRVGGIPRGLRVLVWPQQEEHKAPEQGGSSDLPHCAHQHGRGAEHCQLGPAGWEGCVGCPGAAPQHLPAGTPQCQPHRGHRTTACFVLDGTPELTQLQPLHPDTHICRSCGRRMPWKNVSSTASATASATTYSEGRG